MSSPWPATLLNRARRIRLVALDVDGVLTDGGLYLNDDGVQMKRFYVGDGMGIRLLLDAGISVGFITARHSRLVELRARELNLSFCHQDVKNKWARLSHEMKQQGIDAADCAYMGDDLVDLPVLTRVGFAAAPADARPQVCSRVHWVASLGGGRGAVREMAEGILQAQGAWEAILKAMVEKR
ncbi:MAG: HAD hydrolase family protein [Magnetococcales bacterium]|nr:HAD hydrolase family protein [Magnetococcales bacterium]